MRRLHGERSAYWARLRFAHIVLNFALLAMSRSSLETIDQAGELESDDETEIVLRITLHRIKTDNLEKQSTRSQPSHV